jgi:argininosuccinate lyase
VVPIPLQVLGVVRLDVHKHRNDLRVRTPDIRLNPTGEGVAFRDAHHAVGAVVRLAEKNAVALDQLPTEDVQKINAAFGADWVEVFDLKRALAKRTGTGMPGPTQVARQFSRWTKLLK